MIYVEWHPKWEAEEMLRIHPDLDAHMQAFDAEERPEEIEDPLTIEIDLDNLVNQGFEGNPQSLSESPWLSTTGCAIRKNVTFDFQPTNPQADTMPTWQCEIIFRSVDLMKEALHLDTTDEVAMPTQMPEVTTECACIYNANGKCMGMLTIERLTTLLEAYEAAKRAGIHATIQPPVQDSASEIMGLLSRQKAQQKNLLAQSKKVFNSNMFITPSHIRSALHKWCMVSAERFSSPLGFENTYNTYFSTNYRDQVFGAHKDALSVRYTGFSFCHPPHDDEMMFKLLRHAVHSSLHSTDPVATFMLLPHWRGFSCNACMSWLTQYPHLAEVRAKFPARNIQLQAPQHWFDTIPNSTPPSYPMQLFVVWNPNAREALNTADKD
jgi:hypothetical protein